MIRSRVRTAWQGCSIRSSLARPFNAPPRPRRFQADPVHARDGEKRPQFLIGDGREDREDGYLARIEVEGEVGVGFIIERNRVNDKALLGGAGDEGSVSLQIRSGGSQQALEGPFGHGGLVGGKG